MKKFSSYKFAVLASCSLSLISSNVAFAGSEPKAAAAKALTESSATLSTDRTTELDRELRLVSYDIERQELRLKENAEKYATLDERSEPKAGKVALGFDKMKSKIQNLGKKEKLEKSEAIDPSEGSAREQWKRAKTVEKRKIDLAAEENRPAPEATRLKKSLARLDVKIAQGSVRRDTREAEAHLTKFKAQKEILEGYKSQGLTDREALLARHKLVSDQITAQKTTKREKREKRDMKGDEKADQTRLDALQLERETLEGILGYKHDLEDSRLVNEKAPHTSLEKLQAKISRMANGPVELKQANQEAEKDLSSIAAVPPQARTRLLGLTAPRYGKPAPTFQMSAPDDSASDLDCPSGRCEVNASAGAVN